MGVQTRIVAFAQEKAGAETAAAAAYERIDRLDAIMSDYRRGSELNRLSDAAGGPPVAVSAELYEVLSESQRIAEASGGAFDVTLGPAVALWREARKSGRLPDATTLAAARSRTGYRKLALDPERRTAQLTEQGMRLDLGGIGKGYAAERAVRELRSRGVDRCLVALAGDIYAGDPPPGERGWRVEVQGEQAGLPMGVLLVANSAVSTSGDTEQFVQIAGRRYSHILDSRTGLGLETRRSVTVVAPRGEWADALATAAYVVGTDATRALLDRFTGTAAIIEEPAPSGTFRTLIDPRRVLRWSGTPAVAAQGGPR
jgi:thiamine biosynthesis lipoprotein